MYTCTCIFIPINTHLPSWRMEDRGGRRRGSSWNFRVGLKSRGFDGVSLGLHHSNDALLRSRVVGHALLCRGVPEDEQVGGAGLFLVRAHQCFQMFLEIGFLATCEIPRSFANCNRRSLLYLEDIHVGGTSLHRPICMRQACARDYPMPSNAHSTYMYA